MRSSVAALRLMSQLSPPPRRALVDVYTPSPAAAAGAAAAAADDNDDKNAIDNQEYDNIATSRTFLNSRDNLQSKQIATSGPVVLPLQSSSVTSASFQATAAFAASASSSSSEVKRQASRALKLIHKSLAARTALRC
jgi:hypothetical protein